MYSLFSTPRIVQPALAAPPVPFTEAAAAQPSLVQPIYELFTWQRFTLLPEAPADDLGSRVTGRRFPSPPSSASDHISEEESASDEEKEKALPPGMGDSAPTLALDAFRPGGKYSCDTSLRCQHKEHWDRLRGKRGYSYFECRKCGACWRQPTKSKVQGMN